jgi:molybdopterin/thiamine biosynthesis adenylyltransferase
MNEELEKRFHRQILFPGIGKSGQEKLLQAKVAQVGCGGLGSTLAQCMGRSGIKKLTLIDSDIADVSNLHRQFMFNEDDAKAKTKKATAAAKTISRADSNLEVKGIATRLDHNNIDELLEGHDLILDGLDNMNSRYLLNDWCVKTGTPFIFGGVVGSSGMVMPILPEDGPCLRCLFSDPEAAQSAPNTDTAGIINTLPAHVATIQVTEAQKFIINSKDLIRELQILDLWTGDHQRLCINRNKKCSCCGENNFEFLNKL